MCQDDDLIYIERNWDCWIILWLAGLIYLAEFLDQAQLTDLINIIRQLTATISLLPLTIRGQGCTLKQVLAVLPANGKLVSFADETGIWRLLILSTIADVGVNNWLVNVPLSYWLWILIWFLPVLDINGKILSDWWFEVFINQQQEIVRLASQFIRGMQSGWNVRTGKHYSRSRHVLKEDSHIAMPILNRSRTTIWSGYANFFKEIHRQGFTCLRFYASPCYLSLPWCTNLRASPSSGLVKFCVKELGFDGRVFSRCFRCKAAKADGWHMTSESNWKRLWYWPSLPDVIPEVPMAHLDGLSDNLE